MQSIWLGRVDYQDALTLQRELAALRLSGSIGDVLLLLEHPPTITLGRGANVAHVLASPDRLAAAGIGLYDVDRGGDVTYHGPGQLVGYPILDLACHGRDLHRFLRQLEGVLMAVVEEYGISPRRFPPHTGVWVGDRKIAAIGIKVSRWITTHGFALNVSTAPEDFGGIIPCGISDYGVTSIREEIGMVIPTEGAAERAAAQFETAFAPQDKALPLPVELLSESTQKILARGLDMGHNRC